MRLLNLDQIRLSKLRILNGGKAPVKCTSKSFFEGGLNRVLRGLQSLLHKLQFHFSHCQWRLWIGYPSHGGVLVGSVLILRTFLP